MKHTQGPWHQDAIAGHMIWSKDGMRICDIRGWGHLTGRGAMALSDEEAIAIQNANGALIAAAPDMLEQLEYCVNLLQCHMPPGKSSIWPGCPDSGWLDDYLDAPKAAIAKAKGDTK